MGLMYIQMFKAGNFIMFDLTVVKHHIYLSLSTYFSLFEAVKSVVGCVLIIRALLANPLVSSSPVAPLASLSLFLCPSFSH